ncbi:hypothetical protein OIDMADRAFT_111018, partial [Oidiodendron maius Zn]
PDIFEGFRFANLRAAPGGKMKHQMILTGLDSFTFGHGPHSCPGQYLAIYEIRAILINSCRIFDIRLVANIQGTGGENKRPGDKVYGLDRRADSHCVLEVKRRRPGV